MGSPALLESSLSGAERPRVEVAPPFVDTYGPEFAELMARARKPLDVWQQGSLNIICSIREDRLWACPEYCELCSRQNGKGGIGEARALGGLFLLDEELITWTAHEYKTSMEAFRRMRLLIRTLGTSMTENLVRMHESVAGPDVLVKISNTNGEESFERLDTGQRIKFIARSKGSGRGFSGDCVIIDEAYAYTEEHADALAPTMLARPNPQVIYFSSPPLTGDTGVVLYELKERAEAGGDGSLGYRDWGLAGDLDRLDNVDLDDPQLLAAANPALGTRLTLEKIQNLRRMLPTRRGFARECLGLWPKRVEGGGAIDPKQWAALLDVESRRAGNVAIAVDIAPQRDYAAIGMFGPREDGAGHWQLLDYRPGTDWLLDRIIEWVAVLDPVAVGMGRGTHASLKTELTNRGVVRPEDRADDPDDPDTAPRRGDLAVTTSTDMAAACGQALDAVRHGRVWHIGQHELDAAVAGAKTVQSGDSIAWSRKDGDASPLVSVTLARWAYLTRIDLVDQEEEGPSLW